MPTPASAMPPYESGASGRKLPPWRSASARPAATSTMPSHAAVGDAERAEQGRAGHQEQEDRPAGAIRRRPGPEREVEHDPGSAREREQREDEPHERDVHAEGLRDSRADPGEGTPLSTRREGAQRHPRSPYGARDAHLADADVRVEDEHALAGLDDRRPGVAPVVRLAEDLDLPELGVAAHLAGRRSAGR